MSEQTAISWSDSTWNPWLGCTKVSPACDHCYAESRMDTRLHRVKWGAGQPRARTAPDNWMKPGQWNKRTFFECDCGYRGTMDQLTTNAVHGCDLRFRPTRRRVFCASLADWLDNEVPIEWFVDLLDTIRRTQNFDWLLLTKRIGNFWTRLNQAHDACEGELAAWIFDWQEGRPPANVWMGATVINQTEFNRDVIKLLNAPARIHFLSIEPMLGPIDLSYIDWPESRPRFPQTDDISDGRSPLHLVGGSRINWVIAGGESGHHARPMHPDWVRSLRDQCAAAETAFHFKQHGEWTELAPSSTDVLSMDSERGKQTAEFCQGFINLSGEFVTSMDEASTDDPYRGLIRPGKKKAGRLLDGVEHNGFPS